MVLLRSMLPIHHVTDRGAHVTAVLFGCPIKINDPDQLLTHRANVTDFW